MSRKNNSSKANKKTSDKTPIYAAMIGLLGTVVIALISIFNTRTQILLPVSLTQTAVLLTQTAIDPSFTSTSSPLSTPTQPTITQTVTISSSTNLAPNPSFEDGADRPLWWEKSSMWRNGTILFVWDNTRAYTGQYSLSITDFVPDTCSYDSSKLCAAGMWKSSTISINPSHDYKISVWYINTTPSSNVRLLVELLDENNIALGSTGFYQMEPSDQWKYLTYTLESSYYKDSFPEVTQFRLGFFASCEECDNGSVWIDDVSLMDLYQP